MRRDWGVTRWLVERRPEDVTTLFEVLALPGELLVIVLLLGLVYVSAVSRGIRRSGPQPLCSDRSASAIAIVFGGLALVVLLESVIGLGRPPSDWHAVEASPYGFPSGHVMAATVCWGTLAWWTKRGTRLTRGAIVALLVGVTAIARLLLGVHYLPDVLAGVLLGGAYVWILVKSLADRPGIAFSLGIVIALGAVAVSGGGSRSLLALVGTAGAGVGWVVVESSSVRPRVRHLGHSFGIE